MVRWTEAAGELPALAFEEAERRGAFHVTKDVGLLLARP
jgi:hypothetical protein